MNKLKAIVQPKLNSSHLEVLELKLKNKYESFISLTRLANATKRNEIVIFLGNLNKFLFNLSKNTFLLKTTIPQRKNDTALKMSVMMKTIFVIDSVSFKDGPKYLIPKSAKINENVSTDKMRTQLMGLAEKL